MSKIDRFYYINLDRRPDRNEHFLNQCKIHNLPIDKVQRFAGLDGKTYQFSNDELRLFQNADFRYHPNRPFLMGNQLSHYYILKDVVENNYNYAIIFQDDAVLKDNFLQHVNNIMDNLPSEELEMINIGFHKHAVGKHCIPYDLNQDFDPNMIESMTNEYICKLKPSVNPCSLVYIVSRKSCENFINYIETYGFRRATDHNYNDYLKNKNIYYGSKLILATGQDFGSDIFS